MKTRLYPGGAVSSHVDDHPITGVRWGLMEKNDVQSGGQDPVPKQLFSSLIYSTGHLVHQLTTKQQFGKHQGKGR